MYSSTAYESMYLYIGLELQSIFTKIITSQAIFGGLVLLIFGVLFFMTATQFFSRYIPGNLIKRSPVPLSRFFKVIACLFLGVSLLKVGTSTNIKTFSGKSWHGNKYIESKVGDVQPSYKVSLIFDLLSRTSEEVAAYLSKTVDGIFKTSHSQLEAPSLFYKAVMLAGSQSLDNPELKSLANYYTNECFDRILEIVGASEKRTISDRFFGQDPGVDSYLAMLIVKRDAGAETSCLDLKLELKSKLLQYAKVKSGGSYEKIEGYLGVGALNSQTLHNIHASEALVNHFMDGKEVGLGIHKGSQVPGTTSRIIQHLDRIKPWNVGLTFFGGEKVYGSAMAAKRSQELSEHLSRAPHIAGFIKMILVLIFPFLIFPVVAGFWKILLYWFAIYSSVLLWTPVWTLLYHIVTGIALSSQSLEAFGELSADISLYSAQLITSRVYFLYSVYAWVQLMVPMFVTGATAYFLFPMLRDTEGEAAPDFASDSPGRTTAAGASGLSSMSDKAGEGAPLPKIPGAY